MNLLKKEFKNFRGIAFELENNKYIYDTFSNNILRVAPVVVDILDDTFVMKPAEVIEKYKKNYCRKELETALLNIKKLQKEERVFVSFEIPSLSISSKYSTLQKVKTKIDGTANQLMFNVTEDCNLRCKYCVYSGVYEGRREHNKSNVISWNIGKKAIDFFLEKSSKSKVRYISFYGGEPFFNFKFIKQAIMYTQKKAPDMQFSITTNATLLNDKILDFITQTPTKLVISLDGPQKLHDKYRVFENQKGTHHDVIKKIKLIKEKYPDFYKSSLKINSVLVPHEEELNILDDYFNDDSLFEFLNNSFSKYSLGILNPKTNTFSVDYNYDHFIGQFMGYCVNAAREYHVESKNLSEIKATMSVLLQYLQTLHVRSHKPMDEESFFWPNGICIPGMRTIFVSADGKIFPCEKLYDYREMEIGHVDSGYDYPAIARYIEQYSEAAIDICKKCWAYRFCTFCFLDCREEGGFNIKNRAKYCKNQKYSLFMMLRLYTIIRQENLAAFNYIEKFANSEENFIDQMIKD